MHRPRCWAKELWFWYDQSKNKRAREISTFTTSSTTDSPHKAVSLSSKAIIASIETLTRNHHRSSRMAAERDEKYLPWYERRLYHVITALLHQTSELDITDQKQDSFCTVPRHLLHAGPKSDPPDVSNWKFHEQKAKWMAIRAKEQVLERKFITLMWLSRISSLLTRNTEELGILPVIQPSSKREKYVLTVAFDGCESTSNISTMVQFGDSDVHITMADPLTAPNLKRIPSPTNSYQSMLKDIIFPQHVSNILGLLKSWHAT